MRNGNCTSFRVTLISLVIVSTTYCGELNAQQKKYFFDRVAAEEGLSNSQVMSVLQDRHGFVWFGTQAGLFRYDGNRAQELEARGILSDEFITTLYEDSVGRLWIGTRTGRINLYNPLDGTLIDVQPDSTAWSFSGPVFTVLDDGNGGVWLGGEPGLLRYEENAGLFHSYLFGESPKTVYASHRDRGGTLWIGSETGLSRYDAINDQFESVLFDGKNIDPVLAFLEDNENSIWIGTKGGRIFRLFKEAQHFEEITSTPVRSAITSILQDRTGKIWIGTGGVVKTGDANGQGIFQYDPQAQRWVYSNRDSPSSEELASNDIYDLWLGASNVLWIATWSGVYRLNLPEIEFTTYRNDPDDAGSLSHNRVVALFRDSTSKLWVGTFGGGISQYEQSTETFRHFQHDPTNDNSLSSDNIFSITEDQYGNLWIATLGGGLNKFDPRTQTFSAFRHVSSDSKSISDDNVLSVHIDLQNRLWAGTRGGGLNLFDSETQSFIAYRHDANVSTSISGNYVWALKSDSEGFLWVGTRDAGLNKMDPENGVFFRYTHDPVNPNSLSSNNIYAVQTDRAGMVWVGTVDAGLNKLNPSTHEVIRYSAEHGLPGEMVYGIQADDYGFLWVSTNNGLTRFDPEEGKFETYFVQDGLPSNDFHVGSFFKSRDGHMFFGGPEGFVSFIPKKINEGRTELPIALTNFELFNERYAFDSPLLALRDIRLEHDQNFIAFEFSLLDFASPEKDRYWYKLEGRDREWIDAGSRRYASYGALTPGEYVFHVKGENGKGIPSRTLSMPIYLRPAWFQRWWFKFLFMPGLAIGLLTLAYQYRVSQLLRMERMRLRIAGDLHDDIGSNVSSIALLSELISRQSDIAEADKSRLIRINETAGETIDALREIIWFVDPDHDKLDDVIRKMHHTANDMLVKITHTFIAPENMPTRPMSLEFRRNVYLMFKEIIHNIVQHAKAEQVTIEISYEKNKFMLKVKDDGVGFEEDTLTRVNGLKNLRRRARRAGGHIEIISALNEGTIIIFSGVVENGEKSGWWFNRSWRK